MPTRTPFQRTARAGLAAASLALTLSASADDPAPREQWHQAAAQQYAALADATQALEHSAAAYCESPDKAARAGLEADWLSAYQRWQAVRYIQFGPIEQQSRGWQLQFWPDAKNLVGRKVTTQLKADAPATLEIVKQAGVALQGFPALEYLLYDDAMDDVSLVEPGACALAQNISTHIRQTTQALESDWQAFEEHFETTDGYTHTLLQSAIQSVELLEEKRLATPLGLAGKPANSYRAEAWRSGESVALMQASLEGLQEGVMPGLTALLHSRGHPALVDKLEKQLDEVIARAKALPDGMVRAIETRATDAQKAGKVAVFADLQGFYVQVSQLRRLLASDVAAATGLRRGFNSSDGD
ncbi:MAG: imelysin family protein [Halomonas subglaciescola]|nr:imelysin family protein [Halomonas subglaciescola]